MEGTFQTTADYEALSEVEKHLVDALVTVQRAQGDMDLLSPIQYRQLTQWEGSQSCVGEKDQWRNTWTLAEKINHKESNTLEKWYTGFRICDDSTCTGTPLASADAIDQVYYTHANWGCDVPGYEICYSSAVHLLSLATTTFITAYSLF